MNFIYALLITYGISLIIVHGTIFRDSKQTIKDRVITRPFLNSVRLKFLELVNCMLCVSFWVGAVVGAYFELLPAWNIVFNGGLLTATTWIMHCTMSFLGNGYDPGRVFNLNITEPLKIDLNDKKPETIEKKPDLQVLKG